MPSTSRRTLLGFIAGLGSVAGCAGRDPSDQTDTARASQSTESRTGEPTETPDARASPNEQGLEAPRPSSIESVDADWPMPAFDAANSGRSPDTVGPVDAPRVQWVADVPARGAPPVVADGVAIALGYRGVVTGVDAADGSTKWQVDRSGRPSSPVVDGETVSVITHAATASSALVGLDLETGDEQWSVDGFSEVSGGLTVVDGTVYAAVDEGVLAVDSATGDRRWQTSFPEATSARGPVTVTDDRVVVPSIGAGVVALDRATGERVWRAVPAAVGGVPWRVHAVHDHLYVTTSREHSDPYETPTVVALDPESGDRLGSYATDGAGSPGVAATEDGLVVVDRVTHPPDRPAETPIETVEATPAGTPASTSTGSRKPTRVAGVSADLSTRRWEVEAGTSSWRRSPPAVAGDHVYFGSRKGVIVGIDVTSGERVWTHAFGTPLDLLGPATADGVCVFGSGEGAVALAAD